MAKVLELHFKTAHGKTAKLTVDQPMGPIDTAAIKVAMEAIIASNAFNSTSGDLIAVEGARVIERYLTEYEII